MVRRKIEIKPIKEKSKRHTTFTKRRQGLFRKVDELCDLYDAEAAAFAFSKAGNIYAIGNPHVEDVLVRYLEDDSSALATKEQQQHHRPHLQQEEQQQESVDVDADADTGVSNNNVGDDHEEQSLHHAKTAAPKLTAAKKRIEEALAKGGRPGWEDTLRDLTAAQTRDLEAEVLRRMSVVKACAAGLQGKK